MISLKYHVEQDREDALTSALACCRGLVTAMAASGARACPSLADQFQDSLMLLAEQLAVALEKEKVTQAALEIERELDEWGRRASDYYAQKTAEVREIMLAMTDAAKTMSQRDRQYRAQFTEVGARLQAIGTLDDLTEIRHIVNKTAADLRSCTDRMVEEGDQSISMLRAQLGSYQQRLIESERLSETDQLTGLANRAGVQRALASRAYAGHGFSVLVADLNDFKQVNDIHGHLAGDELLKAFSAEFRAQFRPLDVVGRWGGDEFVAVIETTGPREVQARIDRIRNWACGTYTVPGVPGKVPITAAIGIATWRKGMTPEEVFAQADRAMYADKPQSPTPADFA